MSAHDWLTFAIRLARYESHFVHLMGGDPIKGNLLGVLSSRFIDALDTETDVVVKGPEVPSEM